MSKTSPFAIRVRETGDPDVLLKEPIEIPAPGPGELLVQQEAVGLNYIDTYFRSGLYSAQLPSGIGNEAAGIVLAVGAGVRAFGQGDRVVYFTGPLGAYATHRLVDQERLIALPDPISFEQAAAAMLKGCTAEYLVERCARVEAGQTVLVHAAAGGVGSLLVQWLKAIGAEVIAHSGNAKKAALATALGADHSLHVPMDALAAEVRALTDGRGADVILDGVGAASWQASLDAIARRGLIVSYGNASGPVPPFTALDLTKAGSIFVTRPTLADYCATAEEMRASAERLFALLLDGRIKVGIGARFPLDKAADAHRAIETRASTGSTVLLP